MPMPFTCPIPKSKASRVDLWDITRRLPCFFLAEHAMQLDALSFTSKAYLISLHFPKVVLSKGDLSVFVVHDAKRTRSSHAARECS